MKVLNSAGKVTGLRFQLVGEGTLKPCTDEQVFLEKFLDEFTYASKRRTIKFSLTSFPGQALFVLVYDKIFS